MNKRYIKIVCLVMAVYLALVSMFFLIAREQLNYRDFHTDMLSTATTAGEITAGREVRQRFIPEGHWITSVSLRMATYARDNTAHLTVSITDESGSVLHSVTVSSEDMKDNAVVAFPLDTPLPVTKRQPLYLVLTSPDGEPGNTVTVCLGNSVSTGKAAVPQKIAPEDLATVDGVSTEGALCFQIYQRSQLMVGKVYWYAVAAAGLILLVYALRTCRLASQGKTNRFLTFAATFRRYSFLMKQLILRDFKSRYKRSVLGVLWSFLNPLLTMLVQYVVFSTLFRGDIPNYALYLLTGIVCFNFFSEATSVASQSIVANTPLITKVYVPKIIYPTASVVSSAINLLLSIIPLLIVMLITGSYPKPAIFLLPYGLLCLIFLSTGIGLILATGMVFFKDIQFLWNILVMLWMYMTPIFYPESIIPGVLLPLYRCNPMYQVVTFCRTVLIEGVSPSPGAYLACFLCAAIPMLIGLALFRKKQDDFILYL